MVNNIFKIKICFVLMLLVLQIVLFSQVLSLKMIFNSKITDNDISSYERIFLCTLYNNEAEMAYIHIWRLFEYVDKFIIIVSNITYSGVPKNVTFKSFEQNIHPYLNKVDIVYFNNICKKNEYPTWDVTWCKEMSQRDYAKNYIEENYNPTEKDLLIVVDLDEILTREGIEYIKKNPPYDFYFIKGSTYFPYYYHRLEDWNRGFVVRYNKNMKSLNKYRTMRIKNYNTLKYRYNPSKPLITHCSYCFKDIEEYKQKLKSFSHQEFNKPPYITNNWIFKSHYCREKINSPTVENDEPFEGWKDLIPDDERLKYLVDPSFMYSLDQTTYTVKDLETLCDKKYNRTPFEQTLKYNP